MGKIVLPVSAKPLTSSVGPSEAAGARGASAGGSTLASFLSSCGCGGVVDSRARPALVGAVWASSEPDVLRHARATTT